MLKPYPYPFTVFLNDTDHKDKMPIGGFLLRCDAEAFKELLEKKEPFTPHFLTVEESP